MNIMPTTELEKRTEHLTIFLVKREYASHLDIINSAGCREPIAVPISGCGICQLYIRTVRDKQVGWAELFSDTLNISQIDTFSSVHAALLVKMEDRSYVLTFGQGGRFLVKEGAYEEKFGLLVALNSVDRESFRCVDKQSLDTLQSHTRIQSGYEASADQFGLDVEQDMLKAIVGTPTDTRLGSRMSGTDSLSVSVRMRLADLPFLLRSYKDKFEQDLSKTDYQWVNNISLVKHNSQLVDELDNALVANIRANDHSKVWLAIPEIIHWDVVKGFIYSHGKSNLYTDITLHNFLKTVDDIDSITIDLLKNRSVSCADADHQKVFKHWPIYKCVYAEIDLGANKYILNDGKWFHVNEDFVARTNVDYQEIPYSNLTLPIYEGDNEGEYNQQVSAQYPQRFALLDAKNKISHGGGHGQVEACDLLSIDRQLIHIKIYGKSSVFSHLFSQGFVSGQLLQLDAEFRRKVREKLDAPFDELIAVDRRPRENEYTIIFAVISDQKHKRLSIPFFSRVNLNNTFKMLKGYGYEVELLKIDVDEQYSKRVIGKKKLAPYERKLRRAL